MNEPEFRQPDETGNAPDIKSPALTRLENYWYHYKWHTIGAIILIVAVLICTLQMCGRKSGDISIMQISASPLSSVAQTQLRASLTDTVLMSDGYDISFLTHYIISTKLLQEMDTMDVAYLANTSYENASAFKLELATSEAYICLLSPDVYALEYVYYPAELDKHTGDYESPLFRPLTDFSDALTGTLDAYAIPLSETRLAELPGFSSMPPDTLLCFRRMGYAASWFGKRKAEALYSRHEDVFRAMLAYQD